MTETSKPSERPVYKSQGQTYTASQFLNYFESKVFKTIKKYELLGKGDRVCVATSGGKDSLAVLYMTMLYCKKYDIEFFALGIDEGIKDYRDHTIEDLEIFCNKYNIKLHIVSFKEKFGATLDEVQEKAINQLNKKPCTVCGIFRRALLNRGARELKATKLVTGHNMDDETQSIIMNQLQGNMSHNAALGPISGLSTNEKFVTRVKPLYHISEKETRLFCLLKNFEVEFNECPNIGLSFRAAVRDNLNDIEQRRPGSKNGIINSFLEILPELKQKYKGKKSFSFCTKCGDPCSGNICNTCRQEEQLCIEVK